jgi:hypothetical protein
MRHASMTDVASARLTNECSFRHSSRKLPLKLSMYAFSIGFPAARYMSGQKRKMQTRGLERRAAAIRHECSDESPT